MGHVAAEERRILVAVDESEESLHALSWCLNNMKTCCDPNSQIALTLLHVKRPTCVLPLKYQQHKVDMHSHDVLYSQEWRDEKMACWLTEKAKKICEGYDVKVETKIQVGNPTDLICQMADTLAAELLVMGSHGYGPTARSREVPLSLESPFHLPEVKFHSPAIFSSFFHSDLTQRFSHPSVESKQPYQRGSDKIKLNSQHTTQ
ncbi:hypothetical protein V2J09_023556 [Rumex salicifolius]